MMRPNVSRLVASSGIAIAVIAGVPAQALAEPVKLASPTVVKEVLEDGTGKWQQMADASVGDVVPVRVTGTLPERLDLYDSYAYAFVDTVEETLAVDTSSVKVSLVHADGSEDTDVTSAFEASFDGGVMRVAAGDVKAALGGLVEGDELVLTYEVTLLPGATCGFGDTNDNFCHIEHTRQKVVDSSILATPVAAEAADGAVSGEVLVSTTDAKASVATYAFRVTKVDAASGKALEGASFALADADGRVLTGDGTWSKGGEAATFTTDSSGVVTMYGLDTGDYTLTETKAPSGYDVCEPVKVSVTGDVATTDKRLSASAKGADVVGIDASAGVVSAKVADGESSGKPSDDKPTTTTARTSLGSTGTSGGVSSGGASGGGGALSKTGDATVAVWPVLGAGALASVFGLVLRKVRRDRA